VALNSGLFWPRRSLAQRRGTILLRCLEAIPPGVEPSVFSARIQATIESAVAGLIDESVARQPELLENLQTNPA
jgi:1-acyl-sn-glycerol-3-phosphate acyltransferase